MKKILKLTVLSLFFFTQLLHPQEAGGQIDPTLQKLNLSGFLRTRAWHTSSKDAVPGYYPSDNKRNQAGYQDVFWRNRLYLDVHPVVEIRSVFDVFAVWGQEQFALGNGGTNLITRDVYFVFNPSDTSTLSVGLQPFALPGGYILARDGAGIHYEKSLFKGRVKPYAGIINAVDKSKDTFGTTATPRYDQDLIGFAGSTFAVGTGYTGELYYAYHNDSVVDATEDSDNDSIDDKFTGSDQRKNRLHWLGLRNKYTLGNFSFELGGIYNFGSLRNYTIDSATGVVSETETDIGAGLLEMSVGYRLNDMSFALLGEGATGDPLNSDDRQSFQDIKASRGFSYIGVDNSGGIAIRNSGESSWYGLYGTGLQVEVFLLGALSLSTKLLHYETTREIARTGATGSTHFGNEWDFEAKYNLYDNIGFFFTSGVFLPGQAYDAYVEKTASATEFAGAPIFELMFGARVDY